MTLKCQLAGVKCPPYKHQGIFHPDNESVKSLLPDLRYCARCIADHPPKRSDFEEDLLQIASLTLIKKGPDFDPQHESGASFRSFMRVRICGALMDAKKKEVKHSASETLEHPKARHPEENSDTVNNSEVGLLLRVPDPHAEFEEELVRSISFTAMLPKLLKLLTPREQEVFTCLRDNQRNREIAQILSLSEARVNQLVTQVTLKLRNAAQRFHLVE